MGADMKNAQKTLPQELRLKAITGELSQLQNIDFRIFGTGTGRFPGFLKVELINREVRKLLCPICFFRVRWNTKGGSDQVACINKHFTFYKYLLVGEKIKKQVFIKDGNI